MKIKMRETFQGVGVTAVLAEEGITVSILSVDDIFIIDDKNGAWLVENNKADEIKPPAHYGSQSEPTLRHDDELAKEVAQVVEVAPVVEEETESKPKKRGRK